MKNYLSKRYDFRYNLLSETNEFRPRGESAATFRVLGKRELNAICMEVQSAGITCWDRDLARYVHSTLVESYHPFELYLQELPAWDGIDRLVDLAKRVSSDEYWVKYFHRWMLALVAQWLGKNTVFASLWYLITIRSLSALISLSNESDSSARLFGKADKAE